MAHERKEGGKGQGWGEGERGREGGEEEIPFISVLIPHLTSLPTPTLYPALLDAVTVSTSVTSRDPQ